MTGLLEGETSLLELIAALDAAPLDAEPLGQLADRMVAFLSEGKTIRF